MKDKGVLFTLGVVAAGLGLFTFSVTYDLVSKTTTLPTKLMELEKAGSENGNVRDNIKRIFLRTSGIEVEAEGDTLTIQETLPNNLTQYQSEINGLKEVLRNHFPNTTIDLPPKPAIMLSSSMNFTQLSDEAIKIDLPEETREIKLTGQYKGNITDCSLEAGGGTTQFKATVQGTWGLCERAGQINVSARNGFEINGGAITMEIDGGEMLLSNNGGRPLNYTLNIQLNRTENTPPMLVGHVATRIAGAAKVGEVELR